MAKRKSPFSTLNSQNLLLFSVSSENLILFSVPPCLCVPIKQQERNVYLTLRKDNFFSFPLPNRFFVLSLDKIGCISTKKIKVFGLLFCIVFDLHYLCPRIVGISLLQQSNKPWVHILIEVILSSETSCLTNMLTRHRWYRWLTRNSIPRAVTVASPAAADSASRWRQRCCVPIMTNRATRANCFAD